MKRKTLIVLLACNALAWWCAAHIIAGRQDDELQAIVAIGEDCIKTVQEHDDIIKAVIKQYDDGDRWAAEHGGFSR